MSYEFEGLRPPVFIGLTGLPGVGKTTVAEQLDSFTPQAIDPSLAGEYYDVRTVSMRTLLGWHGYAGGNQLEPLRDYHEQRRQEGEGPAILDRLRKLGNGIFIIDSIRHQQDAEYFSRRLGGYIIALELPLVECERRFTTDNNDEKHYRLGERYRAMPDHKWTTIQQSLREDAWDLAMEEVYDHGISACIKYADVRIRLEATMLPSAVTDKVVEYIGSFIKSGGVSDRLAPSEMLKK